ncbi:LysR family transcriptional regulator [Roseateles chitinivorans]|uniref:LysR family transcriptional regulator n=1 Tax=Roseateles chitinivorans TaxID=2917965 RepID=UPI003D669476
MSTLRLTLRQLQIFAAVAQTGSTSAAADVVSLSQSATSSALNELERLLGLRLFDRAGKRLLLNDNGRALLPRALAQLDGAGAIERLLDEDGPLSLALRLGASTTIGNYVLPRLLPQFLGDHLTRERPSRLAQVRIGNTEAICEAVAAFELDAGLVEGPSRIGELVLTPWLQDEMVLVASPSLLEDATRAFTPKRLEAMVWLLRESGSGTREVTDQLLLPHLRGYRRTLELGSSEAILGAAASGIGVACLSRWVVDDALGSGKVVALTTTLPVMRRQCYLVTQARKQPTRAMARFVEMANTWGSRAGA